MTTADVTNSFCLEKKYAQFKITSRQTRELVKNQPKRARRVAQKYRHLSVRNLVHSFASLPRLGNKVSQAKANNNISELEATYCTQARNNTTNASLKQIKSEPKLTTTKRKESCLRKGQIESQLRKTSHKTTKAGQHQAKMEQIAARTSHNLKGVSAILTFRKF